MVYSIIFLLGRVASVLRFFIGLRTASLERQSKTELLNIREQLRLEKKRVQKEINDVDEKVTRIEQDQTHFVQDIKREKRKLIRKKDISSVMEKKINKREIDIPKSLNNKKVLKVNVIDDEQIKFIKKLKRK